MNPRLIFSSGLTVWITRSQWPASSGSAKGAIRTNQWGHFSELLLRASYVQQHVGKPSNRPKKSKWVSHLESHPSVRGGRDLRKTLVFVSLTTQFSDLSVVYKTKVFRVGTGRRDLHGKIHEGEDPRQEGQMKSTETDTQNVDFGKEDGKLICRFQNFLKATNSLKRKQMKQLFMGDYQVLQ
ncbi:hypothetical protein RUM44_000733 [Polyplax serrata]|uniref:Uncharacterized protein n=1 Tax=Polyplax serrata TaxID=468196 RepID=A0ABR1B8G3_POLSC